MSKRSSNGMSTGPSRRAVLAAMLAAGSAPAAGAQTSTTLPSDPDVVVIGAGAAGIAAAQTLMAAGKSVIVVEAAERIGGRAYTESARLGLPFDHGCAWLQGPRDLPLVSFARKRGFTMLDHDASEALYVDGRRADVKERRAYDRAWGKIEDALEDSDDEDVSAASVIPKGVDWSGTVQTWIGAMDHGVDFADLSTADYNGYEDLDTNYLIEEGLGTVVEAAGAGLPVRLGTPATAVDWSGEGVAVETAAGTIRAQACIVTVSTGVLRSGAIRFTPALPDHAAEGIEGLPMGLLTKIALKTDGARFGLSDNAWLTQKTAEAMPAEACFFLTLPFAQPLMVGFVGGAFGWELSRAGEAAAIDFATNELVKAVGSDARGHITGGLMSDWATNPLSFGAYAAATPGQFDARAALARPVGARVFFAGEAVAAGHMALCSGAWMSGEATARAVAATIDRHCNTCGPKGSTKGATE
ncbi:MAG: NAD(P)/FAD-dependent oxidoreductase [Pseudomonadota bacterium]